jgi:enamine deaminase RidA (YjgF/YER057c/UK114 family)
MNRTSSMPACETAVEWLAVDAPDLAAEIAVARFRGSSGVTEHHITVRLEGDPPDPVATLEQAYRRALARAGIAREGAVFRRVFASDVLNQRSLFDSPAWRPLSLVGQPPVPAAKLALWAWHVDTPSGPAVLQRSARDCHWQRGGLTHHWTSGLLASGAADSYAQSRHVLVDYDHWLESHGLRLADHVVRTWWYVRAIDADYQGLVDARREYFETRGLTADTHYISSTGIQGALPERDAKVGMDAYTIAGLRAEQVEFLTALDHLGPTSDYGVTFERGTAVTYADRRHLFISGTASIDPRGEIVHRGDVVSQLDRAMENVEALLAAAGAGLHDFASMIVYLRDPSDAGRIDALLRNRLPGIPFVLVEGPVCRPGWLIEIEGIAIVPAERPGLPEF